MKEWMCVGMAVGLEQEVWQIFKYEQEGACRAAGGEVLPDPCGGVYLELPLPCCTVWIYTSFFWFI